MIQFEELAYTATMHPARMGERWQASAARARIPSPHTAASMLRSAWCKPDWGSVWPATMNFALGVETEWESAARGGWRRTEKP